MNWYYARGDQRMGPIDDAEMAHLADSGLVNGETLVWNESMADWQPYSAVAPHRPAVAMPASLYGAEMTQSCAECGRDLVQSEMVSYQGHWVCAGCKDAFFQRIREGGAVLNALNYGGFWVRFFARIVDAFILGFVGLIQGYLQSLITGKSMFASPFGPTVGAAGPPSGMEILMFLASMIISTLLAFGYEVYFLGKYGATPGKMVFGLKVVMSDGHPISYGRAIGRFFATYLSGITLYIGYIIAAFDSEKRALHDYICDTRVIRR